jgi:predicted esterase
MVTGGGRVKILDFGLAKLVEAGGSDESAPTLSAALKTGEGVVLGTAAYMSPEQAEGRSVDARSDVFSLGAVLYQMLTGKRPFEGDSQVSTRIAILRETPPPMKSARSGIPRELEGIVGRCLEKSKEARYPTARDLHRELVATQRELASREASLGAAFRRPRIAVPAALLAIASVGLAGWAWWLRAKATWAREEALPEIARLIDEELYVAAFALARDAERFIPGDPELSALRSKTTMASEGSVLSEPAGASVYLKDYMTPDAEWVYFGKTPISNRELPVWVNRWRVTMEGYQPFEGALVAFDNVVRLYPVGAELPAGMTRTPGGPFQLFEAPPVQLQDFWLDTYEVTNEEYKKFVDAGGYESREYWKVPFTRDGVEVSWEEGLGLLRDTTGRAGPSTWELGAYPKGEENYPVRGVSWYEAAAFAEFAGKSLPTIYHWYFASGGLVYFNVTLQSNFDEEGPVPVGARAGLGPFGTYDMAGNVKEWCWNSVGDKRYILGGSWGEPRYMYTEPDARSAFERRENFGLRLAKYDEPLVSELTSPVERLTRDLTQVKPVGEEIFTVYRSLYAYDRSDLNAVVEEVQSNLPGWTREKISFDAAYGEERVIVYLYLPRNAKPPFQTVVYFPGASAELVSTHEHFEMARWDWVPRSGRALVHPVYKGMYERRDRVPPAKPSAVRDRQILWHKDLARAIDYLETRSDIDDSKLAFLGFSLGAGVGPNELALEKRLRIGILVSGGLDAEEWLPESNNANFAPRVRAPVLMLNGRHDFGNPYNEMQTPLFHLLGTPEPDKKHVVLDAGHLIPPRDFIRESLDWLDRYLGPVTMAR